MVFRKTFFFHPLDLVARNTFLRIAMRHQSFQIFELLFGPRGGKPSVYVFLEINFMLKVNVCTLVLATAFTYFVCFVWCGLVSFVLCCFLRVFWMFVHFRRRPCVSRISFDLVTLKQLSQTLETNLQNPTEYLALLEWPTTDDQ